MSEYQKDLLEIAKLNKSCQNLKNNARVRAKFFLEYCKLLDECSEKYHKKREDIWYEATQEELVF